MIFQNFYIDWLITGRWPMINTSTTVGGNCSPIENRILTVTFDADRMQASVAVIYLAASAINPS